MRIALSLLLALSASASPAPAQDATHPAEELDLDSHIAWLDDGAVFLDGQRAKRSLSKEEDQLDRSAFLDQAIEKARQENKLVFWHIPRIIEKSSRGAQMYRAPVLDIYLRQVVFCDPDVADLLNHRFVPVRLVLDEALAERFDLRPLEFIEPAVVFLDGEGRMIHDVNRIRTFDAPWFASLMLRVLDKAGNEPPPGTLTIQEEIAHGLYESALTHLLGAGEPDLELQLEQAGLLRRLRRPDEARLVLDEVRARLDEEQAKLDASGGSRRSRRENPERQRWQAAETRWNLELGRQLTMTGEGVAALRPLDRAFREGNAEAGYLLARHRLSLGDEVGALRTFQLVATRHPETLFGRRARANITLGPDERPLGASFAGFEHFGYLHESAYHGLPHDTSWSGEGLSPGELTGHGLRFLLAQQRADGGFNDSRYAYWGSSEITPNTWVAISALACTALLEHRDALPEGIDPARIDDALARGEDYLFDPKHLNRGANEDVYADAYRLVYLSRRLQRRSLEKDWATERAARIIDEASARQSADGFFAHEYRNAFCTGVMLWSLLEVREAGVPVPAEMIARGVEALKSARYDDGSYSYGGTARGSKGSLKDACGRMPMCEGVLLRTGDGNDARLAFAMDNFWTFYERLEKVRLNDFHSDGELAGFFFFHDLFQTSEVLRLLPEQVSAPTQRRFQRIMQDLPELDGTFVDSHEFGRSYGTAMALLVLKNSMP